MLELVAKSLTQDDPMDSMIKLMAILKDLLNAYLARTRYHSHHLTAIFAENGLDYQIFLSQQHNFCTCIYIINSNIHQSILKYVVQASYLEIFIPPKFGFVDF